MMMRAILSSIVLLGVFVTNSCSRDRPGTRRDPQHDELLAMLQPGVGHLDPTMIKEEVTAEQVWKESEDEWNMVMQNFHASLRSKGLDSREDLIAAKQGGREFWKRLCRVLLEQPERPKTVLRRYDEGPGCSTGYVVLIDGVPKYWLHRRFNLERDNF